MNVIQLEGVTRSYFKAGRVLDDLNLQIQAGEVVALSGKEGAGKTTLVNLIMGLVKPNKGLVRVFGLDPRKHPVEVKQCIGHVAEYRVLPGSLRLAEIFAIYQELYPRWDQSMALELAERFKIQDFQKMHNYRASRARNLALLLALASRPELLILDTPSVGVGPELRRKFLQTAIDYRADSKAAILFTTHQMAEAERMANRVLLLQGGGFVLNKPINSFSKDPAPEVQEILSR